MKHILHVIQSLEFGGAEKVVVQLSNKLSIKNRVSICVTKNKGELCEQLNENIKLFSLNMGEGNNPILVTKLKQLILDNDIDIIHCHDWGVYIESVLAAKLSKRANVILTVHGPYTEYSSGIKSKLKIYLRHIVERFISRYVFKIVTVSNSIKKYIINDINIKENKMCVIHNGVEGYEYHQDDTLVKCRKYITVGRIALVKNHILMLDAFKLLADKYSDVSLTIVGDGPEFKSIQKYADNIGVTSVVVFTGFRNDIEYLLKQHDVFLLSSNYEGISIAGLEAMSLGMPIISTDVGGMSEMIKHNETGLLVNNNDASNYMSALNDIYVNEKAFYKMSYNSRQLFCKEFQEDVALEKYNKLYNHEI
ncbi:MAG: hypothetical protein DIZ80_06440 [endosymbiont of Galathealinum brachiosum]|uniref:Glycosyltransferase n=1 Tax=endosymbiont of Galathealinum brachiosum TaxID=2200906 RepID=A0A370DFU2_9GAMM|nr:MAG: hypothetical protein DIZ80_06440 [endosymbiont of Galathealinum brachiosum]